MRIGVIVAGTLVLATHLPTIAHAGTCPTNTVDMGYADGASSDPVMWWTAELGYDLVTGTLRAYQGGSGKLANFVSLQVRDVYSIVGPPTSEPIRFRVSLRTTGMAGGGMVELHNGNRLCAVSTATIRLASGPIVDERVAESQRDPDCTSMPIDLTQSIELLHLPGETFEVLFGNLLIAGQRMQVQTTGMISFEGLPPGYSIQSCQGYAGPVVPAASRSWGMLKHSYR